MSNMPVLPHDTPFVGEKCRYKNVILVCEPAVNNCLNCYFMTRQSACDGIDCSKITRHDQRDVIFKKRG